MTTVSAPGKLYLFGEYAVLGGSWAVVSAVDRRAEASHRPERQAQYCALGLDGSDRSLVDTVLGRVAAATETDVAADELRTDVREMFRGGQSLGLGSSAASAVALTGVALASSTKRGGQEGDFRGRAFDIASRAHREFQGGRGSGGGVAAAAHGGTLAFRRTDPDEPFERAVPSAPDPGESEASVLGGEGRGRRLSLPPSIEVRAVWLGASAATTRLVDRVGAALRAEADAKASAALEGAGSAAAAAIDAIEEEDVGGLVETVRRADWALERLGEAAGCDITTRRHRSVRRVARKFDLAAKPSGAGGGDFSLLVGPTPVDWTAVGSALPDAVELFDLAFGAAGLRLESDGGPPPGG